MFVHKYELYKRKLTGRPYLKSIGKVELNDGIEIRNAAEVAKIAGKLFDYSNLAEEEIHCIFLSGSMKPIGFSRVSKGGVSCTCLTLRSIFERALLLDAVGFIMLHNHPSGSVSPSTADIETTNKVKTVAELMGVIMFDHIIMGNGYFSFVQNSMM